MKKLSVILAVFLSASVFASSGFDGSDGMNGSSGSDGRNASIVAQGQSLRLDLSGRDGGNGWNGTSGGDATCFNANESYRGGDGGDGGSGGDGGDSGDLTVRFANKEDLKKIYVDASPGRGGRGGNGATAGRGCGSGGSGWDGSDGRQGRDGDFGKIHLIPQLEMIAETQPTAWVPVAQLDHDLTLSREVWEYYSGSRALFASGSQLNPNFYYFKGIRSFSVRVEWQASRPKADFPNVDFGVHAGSDQVKHSISGDLLAKVELAQENGVTVFRIKSAFSGDDVTALSVTGFGGNASARSLLIRDAEGVSKQVKTTVELNLKSQSWLGIMSKRFNGPVPANALKITDNKIEIDFAKLGLDPKDFKSGKKSSAQLQIARFYGEESRIKKLSFEGVLP